MPISKFCMHPGVKLHFTETWGSPLMRAAIEISMYPLGGDYRACIQAFIDRMNTHPELVVRTNAMSTQIWGALDRMMAILNEEIARAAAGAPQLVFVMKVLPGLAPP